MERIDDVLNRNRAGWHEGNAFDFYTNGIGFESCPEHRLF